MLSLLEKRRSITPTLKEREGAYTYKGKN